MHIPDLERCSLSLVFCLYEHLKLAKMAIVFRNTKIMEYSTGSACQNTTENLHSTDPLTKQQFVNFLPEFEDVREFTAI
jgi:hypothetical protein